MELTPKIELHERRCYECGQWWASERANTATCPVCAQRRIDRAVEAQAKLERSVAALKGALTRSRKREGF